MLEAQVVEETLRAAAFVFLLGPADGETYLLALDSADDDLVYARYRHDGGQTNLYVDGVLDATVGSRAPETTRVEESAGTG